MATGQPPVPTVDKGISQSGVTFIGVIVAVCILSGTAVGLRVSGRLKEFHKLHKDDWTIILAWLTCLTTVSITIYWVAEAGVGWSILELPPAQLLKFFKVSQHRHAYSSRPAAGGGNDGTCEQSLTRYLRSFTACSFSTFSPSSLSKFPSSSCVS